jgi:ADP-heptose:LPS heptosyltransferase
MAMRVGGKGPALLSDVRYDIVAYTRGRGLDIGRGEYKAFPHFIGVREKGDDIKDPVVADFEVESFANLSEFIDGELNFMFIWGIGPEDTIKYGLEQSAEKLLMPGGFYINVWQTEPAENEQPINACFLMQMGDNGKLVRCDPKFRFEPVAIPWHRMPTEGEKTACVIRYGAIGDMLQTASILPVLKREGYHVTVNCHPEGELVLRYDPNIDSFSVQDKDQVPNEELQAYWKNLATKYDRVINLCESVEGALLLHPGRANHRWPHAMRKKYCNLNYLEFMSEIAELPFNPDHHFVPTEEEANKAKDFIADIRAKMNVKTPPMTRGVEPYVVMIALAGSSVHKFYPHQDTVIAEILLRIPNSHVVLIGGPESEVLEGGWESNSRVSCLSGKLPIRDSIALAQVCQLVIGPETGLLNAVAFETNAKIVLLSHSTEENLTRDWTNTEALHSLVTPCYPCHRLHYNHDFCPQDETTKAAMCQVELQPSAVMGAVQKAHVGWGTVRNLLQPQR